MAHTKSALKRVRQSRKLQLRNQAVKSTVRTATRAFRETLEGGDAAKVQPALRTAVKTLGKAATKGVIHPRTASRRTSRLAKAANRQQAAAK
jgi:small subunit ribosomal protein S20